MTRKLVSCWASIFLWAQFPPSFFFVFSSFYPMSVCCVNECEAKSNNLCTPSSGICLSQDFRAPILVQLAIVLLSTKQKQCQHCAKRCPPKQEKGWETTDQFVYNLWEPICEYLYLRVHCNKFRFWRDLYN